MWSESKARHFGGQPGAALQWSGAPQEGLCPPDGLSASLTAFTSRLSLTGLTFQELNFTLRLLCLGSRPQVSNTGFVLTLGNDFNVAGIKIPRRAQSLAFRLHRDQTRSRNRRGWFCARSMRGKAGRAPPGAPDSHLRRPRPREVTSLAQGH